MHLTSAIFLDRDNTLTKDDGYTFEITQFQWMPGAPKALRAFHEKNIPVFIVTNQGGIGRGFFTIKDMQAFHQHLHLMVKSIGGKIHDIAYCPHHPLAIFDEFKTPCRCRKPKPGMLFDLAKKWQLDLSSSVMIGDRESDFEAGQRAGCHSYLYNGDSLYNLAKKVISEHFQ